MFEALKAHRALSPEQKALLTTKRLEGEYEPRSLIELLRPIAAYDRMSDKARTPMGCATGALFVLAFVLLIVAANVSPFLLVLPVAVFLARLVPDHDQRPTLLSGRLLTAVQAPLVVVCARVAGVRTTAERAILVSGACLALATAILALALGHRPDLADPPPGSPADDG